MNEPVGLKKAKCCYNCTRRETSIFPCKECNSLVEEQECTIFGYKFNINDPEMVCDIWSDEE